MKHIVPVSVAIVALGFLSGSLRPVPSSRLRAPRALLAVRRIQAETRSFDYGKSKIGVGGGETITRNGDMISGHMVMGANHARYEGRIAADGTIPRLDIRAWRSAAEAKHPRVFSAIFGRDSTLFIERLKSRVDTLRFASQPGMVPVINPSVGLSELVVARARAQKSRSVKVPILFIDALNLDTHGDKVGAGPMALDVTFLAADTVRIGNGTSTDQMRLIVGADGRCRSGGSGSTAKDKFSFWQVARPVSSRE